MKNRSKRQVKVLSVSSYNNRNSKVMKKLRANMDRYFDKLDERWRALPLRKQHQYTLYFFVGYLLLTAGVIYKVWYDTSRLVTILVSNISKIPSLKKNKNLEGL